MSSNYDAWKTTNPADEFLGPDPEIEMATGSLTYTFEELALIPGFAEGRAEIEYDQSGNWQIYKVILTGLVDAEGNDRDDAVSTDIVKAAVIAQRFESITDAVIEELMGEPTP